MSILCVDDTHVWEVPSTICTCGMWGIPGHAPNSFAPIRPNTPPVAGEAPPVSLKEFAAARLIGSHLSADGLYVYTMRYGKVLEAKWNGSNFGAWLDIGEEMPPDVVKM